MRYVLYTSILFGVLTAVATDCAAQKSDDDRSVDVEALRENIERKLELKGEESDVLRDALRQIAEMRERQNQDPGEDADDDAVDHGEQIVIDIAADEEALGKQFEEQMESFEKSVEAWAEDFELHAEKWAEEYGENMEVWAEQFGESWEAWAKVHGEEWEQWGEQYGSRWEEWAQMIEDGDLTKDDIKQLVEANLEMVKEMPLDGLYDQLSRSNDQLKDLPWDSLDGIEELIADSVQQGLRGLEELSDLDLEAEGKNEVARDVRKLKVALEKLKQGLDTKSAELEVAKLRAVEELLSRQPKNHKVAKRLFEKRKAVEKAHRAKHAQARQNSQQQAAELAQQREFLQQQLEAVRQADTGQRAELQAMAERIAVEQLEQNNREMELDVLRKEIANLREEVERLRREKE
jgi:hypothetical protein